MINENRILKKEGTDYRYLSVKQLMWRKFLHNRVAVASTVILIFIYIAIIFAEFFAPYNMREPHSEYLYSPPIRLRFIDYEGSISLKPFVYKLVGHRDPETLLFVYEENRNIKYYIRLFIHGENYKLLGFYEADLHLFGVEGGEFFLLGTDHRGRCQLSRILYGGRVSMTIPLIGVFIIMLLGSLIGIISGYYGGWIDNFIQRFIEILRIFPRLALWMALAAAIPPNWPSTFVYLGIIVVLGFIGWPGLAREVRGKVLSLRESEYIAAAKIAGASNGRIIFKHLLPNISSHIIVIGTLAIPYLILGESALSFLGLGIKPPMTSWGLLLSQANKIQVLRLYPWMLIPGLFIIISVLCFNYVGDALRDVIDPFAK
jgi:peptide/nickel transport system permease protein